MIQKGPRIPVADILPLILDHKQKKTRALVLGDEVKVTSKRLSVFKKSTKCVSCGIEGVFFLKEKSIEHERYHLNLYALDGETPILMTRDHIIPRSKGGADTLNNSQTMCCRCNEAKGDTLECV